MAAKKFYISPDAFADFLLGRDVNIRSIDLKGVDHPIFKDAAAVFLGEDDDMCCKAIHAYWVRRGQEIVRILKYESNVERKKEARLKYFLEMTGLKLVKREEILKGPRADSAVRVTSPEKQNIENPGNISVNRCNYDVSSSCAGATLPQVVAMEIEIPQCDIDCLAASRNESSSSNYDSEGEKEDSVQDLPWKKEGEFTLSATEWLSMYEKGSKLSRKWTSIISEKFFKVNKACVIQFQGYHFNKQSRSDTPFLMMRGYCAHVSCKRFRLTMQSAPVANKSVSMTVWGRGTEKHGDKKKTRQLKGWDRLNARKALVSEMARKYREEKLNEVDKSALLKGNLQSIKSLSVLRRTRAEALKEKS